jgi:hypothetical protein
MQFKTLYFLIIILSFSVSLFAQQSGTPKYYPCMSTYKIPNTNEKAAFFEKYRWDSGQVLRIYFLDGSAALQTIVKDNAVEWTKHCSLKFQFVNQLPADIRISFKGVGLWSKFGTESRSSSYLSKQPSMNLR